MKHSIKPGSFPSVVNLPSSKSYANRALILAALKPGRQTIENLSKASDVVFLIEALKKIGLEIEESSGRLTIANSFPACELPHELTIDVGEGGTTARFLASMLLLGHKSYTLLLGPRLKERPWKEFISLAKTLGAKVHLQDDQLTIQGPVVFPSVLKVDCSRTTQFASGLQLTSAFCHSEIIPENMTSSSDYWDMTKTLIEHFKMDAHFSIPLDWSSASYPLAFGAIKQDIFFPGLHLDSFQADSKFGVILKEVGALYENKDGIGVRPIALKKDFNLDVSGCLDLVPALSFYLAHIPGTHHLRGIENLVHKESDRLTEVINLLKRFQVPVFQEVGGLRIVGATNHGISRFMDLEMKDDHRMVMSAALFLRFYAGGIVSPALAVNKSYPDFFSLLT